MREQRERRRPGRPNGLTPERRARFFEAIRSGLTKSTAARYAGISEGALYRYFSDPRYREFQQTFARERAAAEVMMAASLVQLSRRSTKAAVAWLEALGGPEWQCECRRNRRKAPAGKAEVVPQRQPDRRRFMADDPRRGLRAGEVGADSGDARRDDRGPSTITLPPAVVSILVRALLAVRRGEDPIAAMIRGEDLRSTGRRIDAEDGEILEELETGAQDDRPLVAGTMEDSAAAPRGWARKSDGSGRPPDPERVPSVPSGSGGNRSHRARRGSAQPRSPISRG